MPLRALPPDLDNLRAALDWAARDGADGNALVALAGASWWIWFGALKIEGQRRCAQAMSRTDSATPKPYAARLLLGYAYVAHPKASPVEIEALERGNALCRETGDRNGLYFGLTTLVFRLAKLGRLDEAWRAVDEACALQSDDLPPGLLPRLLTPRAHLHAMRGDYDAAMADKLAVLHAYERLGDERGVRIALGNVVDIVLARGDVPEAVRRGREEVAALRHGSRVHMLDSAGVVRQPGYRADACGRVCRSAAGGARGPATAAAPGRDVPATRPLRAVGAEAWPP